MRHAFLILASLCLATAVTLAEEITTGTALSQLQETPPAPPKGYPTSAAVLLAVQQGKVKVIQLPRADGLQLKQDITYGQGGNEQLKLDLYSPAKLDQPAPGIILIHGGAWKGGRKEDYAIYGRRLAKLGYVVASIDYRLTGVAQFPAQIEDCKCAVRWMRANAQELKIDPDRIGVAGGSAGGHLALMVGYCDSPEWEGNGGHAGTSSRVQCVVDLYGPADLTTDFVRNNQFANTVVRELLGKTIDDDLKLYQQASPRRHLTPDDPPTLILHGTVDDIVPIDQSDTLAALLTEKQVPYVYDRLPGWPHAMDLSQEVNDRCMWFMERFFARYLKEVTQSPVEADAEKSAEQQGEVSEWTPQKLLEAIEAERAEYVSFAYRLSDQTQKKTNYMKPEEPENLVEGTSSRVLKTDGTRWQMEFKSFTFAVGGTQSIPIHEFSGFDGAAHYREQDHTLYRGVESPGIRQAHPNELFWSIGKNYSWLRKSLSAPEAEVIGNEIVDEIPCVRVKSTWSFKEGEPLIHVDILIAPQHSFLPIRCTVMEGEKNGSYWQLSGIQRDAATNLCYPTGILQRFDLPFPIKRRLTVISSFEINPQFGEHDFDLASVGAMDVVDYTRGEVFFNEAWHPELSQFTRDQLSHPAPWLDPTDQLLSYADPALQGQSAPELKAASWINGNPGPWKRDGRKWTILHFFGGGLIEPTPEQMCGLRDLLKKYADLGVDLIGVVPDDQAVTAANTVRELSLDFPVAVSEPASSGNGFGQIHADYQLKTYGGTFLIDPEGKVQFMNRPEAGEHSALPLEQRLITLLGLNAPEFQRPENGFPIEDWRQIIQKWRQLRAASPAEGVISGQLICERQGVDFSGVQVQLIPFLSVVHGHNTAGHTVQADQQDAVSVTSNAAGFFTVSGLRKSTYKVIVSGAPIQQQEVYLNVTDEHDVSLDVGPTGN